MRKGKKGEGERQRRKDNKIIKYGERKIGGRSKKDENRIW